MLVLYWILVVVMLVGIIGAVVPALPGSSLILGAILVWGVVNGFRDVGLALGVTIAVLLISVGIDFLSAYLGAKQAGASRWGQTGAMIGLVLGFLGFLPALPFGGPLLGILIGPLLGAIVGEFLYRKDLAFEARIKLAFKASIGIVVGSFVGNLIEGILATACVVVFLVTTWPYNL
ncbi:MAG: DUF456 family protein [Limnoraphis sp. WC205]|jgi:uncharacterized protein YqgC (DUF456 family)|uniref:DUF456 domain-containing protein n=1 Tax=Limnoraphis robusta TaxID=1118279 RepID=UPI001F8B51B8|nr:DUF456 family protein [Limnoraphis robusta]MCG5059865.1 DUF456 family protein [Limnoraphis sp. WC205]MEA5501440.1 DUF456 family protein [Limnoraphis robusta BA-68 BA1]